jgi:hypothetical protein
MLQELNAINGASEYTHGYAERCKTEFEGPLYGLEMGVAYGGGVRDIGRLWKGRGTVWGFDTFEGHPRELAFDDKYAMQDGGIDSFAATCMNGWYDDPNYGADAIKYDYIRKELDAEGLDNVVLVKGLVTDTTDVSFIPKLHYALIDMDFPLAQWNGYNLVKNLMVPGGILFMHDMIPKGHIYGCYEYLVDILVEGLFEVVLEEPKSFLIGLRKKA